MSAADKLHPSLQADRSMTDHANEIREAFKLIGRCCQNSRIAPNVFDTIGFGARNGIDALGVLLAGHAAEVEQLRQVVAAQERELARAGFVLGISGDRRESIEYVLDKTEAERDAAAADRDRLAEALAWIKTFALAHHADQEAHIFLHALTIDIPAYVDAALAGREGSDDA